MTHQIKNRVTELEGEQKKIIDELNVINERRQELHNTLLRIQGAITVLKEVDHEHTDQPTESDPS
tara:strand:+ start:1337 stop:1531 length:195 start_codon:yes stop_codon:yes gene_type:complete